MAYLSNGLFGLGFYQLESFDMFVLMDVPRMIHLLFRNDSMCVCLMFGQYGILSPFSLLNKSVQKFVILSLYDLKIPGFPLRSG